MVDALKSIDKKYLMIIGGIFGILLLVIIVLASMKGCSGPSKNYQSAESKMVKAAKEYFKEKGLPENGKSKEVSVTELSGSGKMKKLDKILSDKTCDGKVTIYNNNDNYLVVPHLECSEYKTKHLKDKIIEDSEVINPEDPYKSGLYKMDDKYVFRGKNPNNYVSFGGLIWRIIDIDKDGTIRVIKVEPEKNKSVWDNKYNVEVNKNYGINDYKNSVLLERLNSEYSKFKKESKKHLSSFNVCIGKRNPTDIGIDYNIDCSEILENQYISVINVSDYSRPSLDEHCDSIVAGACTNYNYMLYVTGNTWTVSTKKDSTYNAIMITGGVGASDTAKTSSSYNWVVAFRGDELYTQGDGSANNPYLISNEK